MDVTTHPSLKEASLVDIVNGYEKMQVTHEHKGNQWIGYVFIDVKDFEQYEWLWIEFAGRSDKVSSKVYIFAKKAHQRQPKRTKIKCIFNSGRVFSLFFWGDVVGKNKMVKTLALFALLVYNVIARNMGNLAVATRYGQLDHKEVNKL